MEKFNWRLQTIPFKLNDELIQSLVKTKLENGTEPFTISLKKKNLLRKNTISYFFLFPLYGM